MSEPAPEACPTCGEGPVQQVLYPVAIHYKGSGFYSTDYGRAGRKKDASKDGDSSSESKSDDKKSDKKDKPPEKKAAET
jgi:predicted nucleic acid-binding Zn ribbon protein